MDRPIIRAHVDDFHEHGEVNRRWHMDLSGTGPLPYEVLKAIAGGPVLVTFERGSGGPVVLCQHNQRQCSICDIADLRIPELA